MPTFPSSQPDLVFQQRNTFLTDDSYPVHDDFVDDKHPEIDPPVAHGGPPIVVVVDETNNGRRCPRRGPAPWSWICRVVECCFYYCSSLSVTGKASVVDQTSLLPPQSVTDVFFVGEGLIKVKVCVVRV
jgi:hypothetical protein